MITRAEYRDEPYRLHHVYYVAMAREAGVKVPEWLMLQVRRSKEPEHLTDITNNNWGEIALKYKNTLADAMARRGCVWSFIGGICAVKAMAQHQLENENVH